jgi:2-C-methyl-D-erythritol 4-phosphate cytidylyltransferase
MSAAALLLAAGKGKRLGTGEPKALVHLAGRPLLSYSVDTVERCPDVEGFLVVATPERVEDVRAAAGSPKLLGTVAGGQSRQESVRLGLGSLPDGFDEVLCHDVARPLASPELFSAVVAALRRSARPVIPVVAVVDSIKRIPEGSTMSGVPRDGLFTAQTPQGFPRAGLVEAHARALAEGVVATDDADLCEQVGLRSGEPVPGERANIKITEPEDLAVAEAIVRARGG